MRVWILTVGRNEGRAFEFALNDALAEVLVAGALERKVATHLWCVCVCVWVGVWVCVCVCVCVSCRGSRHTPVHPSIRLTTCIRLYVYACMGVVYPRRELHRQVSTQAYGIVLRHCRY